MYDRIERNFIFNVPKRTIIIYEWMIDNRVDYFRKFCYSNERLRMTKDIKFVPVKSILKKKNTFPLFQKIFVSVNIWTWTRDALEPLATDRFNLKM